MTYIDGPNEDYHKYIFELTPSFDTTYFSQLTMKIVVSEFHQTYVVTLNYFSDKNSRIITFYVKPIFNGQ